MATPGCEPLAGTAKLIRSSGDFLAFRIEQRGFHFRLDGRGGVVFQRVFHADRGRVAGDLRRSHKGAPLREVHRFVHHKLHLAIDARARIPARVVLARVHVDRHDIRLCPALTKSVASTRNDM